MGALCYGAGEVHEKIFAAYGHTVCLSHLFEDQVGIIAKTRPRVPILLITVFRYSHQSQNTSK
jgi:hypothetical protein